MPKVLLKNGLQIHYQRSGHGPDVVMIHGLTGNLAVWHLKILPLIWDEYRVLTYDLRGHGYSGMPPTGYTPTDMANDLLELLDALELERPALVGHSYGADIALYFALHYPERVRHVVALEAALPAMIRFRAQEDWEGWTYWHDVLEKCGYTVPPERRYDVDFLFRATLNVPKQWGPLNGLPRNPEPFLRLIETTTMTKDYEQVGELTIENIHRISTPTTLIYCERSAFLKSYQYLSSRLPDVRSVLLPRTDLGHFGPLEQPELVAEHILTALRPERPEPKVGAPVGAGRP